MQESEPVKISRRNHELDWQIFPVNKHGFVMAHFSAFLNVANCKVAMFRKQSIKHASEESTSKRRVPKEHNCICTMESGREIADSLPLVSFSSIFAITLPRNYNFRIPLDDRRATPRHKKDKQLNGKSHQEALNEFTVK